MSILLAASFAAFLRALFDVLFPRAAAASASLAHSTNSRG